MDTSEAAELLASTWASLSELHHATPPPQVPTDGHRFGKYDAGLMLARLRQRSDGPDASPELTQIRDELHLWVHAPVWRSHPLSVLMLRAAAGDERVQRAYDAHQLATATPTQLVDLAELPESGPQRAALLTASAMTAEQLSDRERSGARTAKAREAAQLRAAADEHAAHHERALSLLPAAFDGWQSDTFAAIKLVTTPAAPEHPTVPATYRPVLAAIPPDPRR